MKKHKKLFNVFTGVLLVALLVIGVGWSIGEARSADRGDMVEVLIGFESKIGPSERALVQKAGGEIQREFTIVDVIHVKMNSRSADALARNPNVKYVEPNAPVYALSQTVPWGIDRVFGKESYLFPTWETASGTGIGVAILDTGIYCDHEDLKVVSGENTVDDTNYCADGHGHGTHVAGTVAALDNNFAVVGVAPDVNLYAVKVLNDSGSGSIASIVAGIEWVIKNKQNVRIINMSLGSSNYSETLKETADKAYSEGILLVAAAGNSGNPAGRGDNVIYPAAYDSVIAVAASDNNDRRASFSSTGPTVELIAPGADILSTWKDNNTRTANGTSMASPHVAGVAALVWATNHSLTNIQVRAILQDTAENIGLSSDRQGHGLIRADLAVKKALENQPDPITDPELIYTVKIEANDQTKKTGTPGDEVTYSFTITNTGTKDDTYDISVDTNGWSATTSTSSITIVAGGFVDITVTHSIPDSTGDDDSDTGTLRVSSDNASSTAYFTTTVEETTDPNDPNESDLLINTFIVTNTSNPAWARVTVDWEVSGAELKTVKIELIHEGSLKDSKTINVSGSSASSNDELRDRGGHGDYTVELTVTDGNGTVSETKNITL